MRRSWMVVAMAAVVVCCGCSLLNPGADVRQATESRQTTTYTADGTFTAAEDTTHNRRNVLAESVDPEGGEMEWYPDGTPKKASRMSNIMTQSSEPKDAASAYMLLATKNAEVAGKMMDTVSMLIPMLMTRSAPAGAAGPQLTIEDIQRMLSGQPMATATRPN